MADVVAHAVGVLFDVVLVDVGGTFTNRVGEDSKDFGEGVLVLLAGDIDVVVDEGLIQVLVVLGVLEVICGMQLRGQER